jgi:RsiW-degrading membrane proteinase PrsW (M82 family)
MGWVGAVGLVAAGAVLWSIYFRFKDRFAPEPLKLLGVSLILGGLAAGLALAGFRLLEAAGLPELSGLGSGGLFLYCVGAIGVVEEGAKFVVFRTVMVRWREFDEPIDGLVYAAMVAIGFACVENLIYSAVAGWPEQIGRAMAAPLTHSLFAAIWGLPAARALLVPRSAAARFSLQAGPLAASMALHGFYDFLLLEFDATYAASAVILVLWVGLIAYCGRQNPGSPRAVRQSAVK